MFLFMLCGTLARDYLKDKNLLSMHMCRQFQYSLVTGQAWLGLTCRWSQFSPHFSSLPEGSFHEAIGPSNQLTAECIPFKAWFLSLYLLTPLPGFLLPHSRLSIGPFSVLPLNGGLLLLLVCSWPSWTPCSYPQALRVWLFCTTNSGMS